MTDFCQPVASAPGLVTRRCRVGSNCCITPCDPQRSWPQLATKAAKSGRDGSEIPARPEPAGASCRCSRILGEGKTVGLNLDRPREKRRCCTAFQGSLASFLVSGYKWDSEQVGMEVQFRRGCAPRHSAA